MAHEWTQLYPPGGYPENQSWSRVACSADGTVILAGQYNGRLYLSTDRGDTWTEQQPAGDVDAKWWGCAVDSDGSVLLAVAYNGRVYLSTNGGTSWTEKQPKGDTTAGWRDCCCDADGSVLLVVESAPGSGGRCYLSTNGGTNWSETQPAGAVSKYWHSCSCDSDGSVLLVGAQSGRLYLSTNTGTNWTEQQPAGAADKNWYAVAADSDGSVLMAGAYNGRLYLSTNTGSSWSEVQPAGDANASWTRALSDADGSDLIAAEYNGRVWHSTDSGSSWTELRPAGDVNGKWEAGCCDSDASVVILGGSYWSAGRLYLGLTGCPVLSYVNPSEDGAAVPGLTPYLTFGTANDDAAAVHIELVVSQSPNLGSPDINSDSSSDYASWQVAASPFETWTTMTSGGAPAGNQVRYPVTSALRYDVYFATAQLDDGTHRSGLYRFTFTIVAESTDPLVVIIGTTEYYVGACRIAEETGGEAGALELEVPLSAWLANPWTKGDPIAISSGVGGGRTWNGTVETWTFSGSVVRIHGVQDDGYLSRRVATGDLASDKLGGNLRALVDAYGAPLTGFNIDQETTLYGAITGGYKYLREHFSDALKQLPNYLYWVDETGDVHFIDQDDIETAEYTLFEADPS